MALGLALFYRSTSTLLKALGIALFVALALLRPGLALAFVPLTAPLYIIPVWLTTIREGLRLPLHEIVLWITLVAAVVQFTMGDGRWTIVRRISRARVAAFARQYAPHLLLLLSGALGVLLAVERGAALREFRWLVVEPLLFYALLRRTVDAERAEATRQKGDETISASSSPALAPVVGGFIVGGAVVGLLGLLQYYGYDLVPLIFGHQKQIYSSADTVAADGLLRVTSVYGHPNNVGLYLGRMWPIAATLWIYDLRFTIYDWRRSDARFAVRGSWFTLLASGLCLAGIIVSFSRGAWFGIGAALAVLAVGWLRLVRANRRQMLVALACVALVIAVLVGWSLALRGETGAGSASARLLIWRESLRLLWRHPLGLGLDQFIYYHNPFYGRSLMDPSLLGTSEATAAHPHNLLLDTWLSVGPLGVLAFGWLLVRAARQVRAIVRAQAVTLPTALALGAGAALAAALVHGAVDSFYFHWTDLAFAFWLLIALIEAGERAAHGADAETVYNLHD